MLKNIGFHKSMLKNFSQNGISEFACSELAICNSIVILELIAHVTFYGKTEIKRQFRDVELF